MWDRNNERTPFVTRTFNKRSDVLLSLNQTSSVQLKYIFVRVGGTPAGRLGAKEPAEEGERRTTRKHGNAARKPCRVFETPGNARKRRGNFLEKSGNVSSFRVESLRKKKTYWK
ncbi:hypothetical protein Tco_1141818 [Tanacetum coccineum]